MSAAFLPTRSVHGCGFFASLAQDSSCSVPFCHSPKSNVAPLPAATMAKKVLPAPSHFPQSPPLVKETNLGVTLSLLLHADTRKISTQCLCQPIRKYCFSFSSSLHQHFLHFYRLKEIGLLHFGEKLVWRCDLHFLQQHLEQKGDSTPHPGGAVGCLSCLEAVASTALWLSGFVRHDFMPCWIGICA